MRFNWQQTALIMVAVLGLAAFVVRAVLTGEDIPTNFQILFGAIIGLALGGAGISALTGRKDEQGDKKGGKKDE